MAQTKIEWTDGNSGISECTVTIPQPVVTPEQPLTMTLDGRTWDQFPIGGKNESF